MERTIFLVDLDTQANLTACCGVGTESVEKNIYDVFITVACEHFLLVGVSKLPDTIKAIRENYNTEIRLGRVIPAYISGMAVLEDCINILVSIENALTPDQEIHFTG
jgi:cellulose biosynthesis protein BcsQ